MHDRNDREWDSKGTDEIKEKLWSHSESHFQLRFHTSSRNRIHIRANTFYIEKWQNFFIQHFTFIFCSSSSSTIFFSFLIISFLPLYFFIRFYQLYVFVVCSLFLRIGYDGFVMVAAVRECANMDGCVCVCLCIVNTRSWANIQLSIFVQRFFNEGPGAVDMDDGIKLMERYSDQFKLLEQQRHEFGNEIHTQSTIPPMPASSFSLSLSTITISEWMWQKNSKRNDIELEREIEICRM